MKKMLSVGLMLVMASCASNTKVAEKATPVFPKTVEEAVNSTFRVEENKKRDIYRHPVETLNFFGVAPEMTVVEIWPSGGWYTQILAPLLVTNGKYIIADPPADPNGYTTKRVEWLASHPEIGAKVEATQFLPPTHLDIAPENSADMVLTFRNVHNWGSKKNQELAFAAFFKALKPGGTLGVVEHRAANTKKFDPKKGYVKESEVLRMAKKAGFKLVEKSEINANPKDLKNYPKGVWTLPPTLAEGDKDRQKYLEIGESDRMTLKFVKPAKK
ncbi:hypothetical protein D3C87_300090 [compost metagenome]